MRAALALLVVAALFNPAAEAQPEPSSIGVSFDTGGFTTVGIVPGLAAPTRLYLMMLNLAEPIFGFETGISITGAGSEDWIVQPSAWPGFEIDLVPDDPYNLLVTIGACVSAAGADYELKAYDFFYALSAQAPSNTYLCAGPPTAGTASIPGFPSYRNCSDEYFVTPLHSSSAFPAAPDGCSIINCTLAECVVATESSSWGSIKSKY